MTPNQSSNRNSSTSKVNLFDVIPSLLNDIKFNLLGYTYTYALAHINNKVAIVNTNLQAYENKYL